jgi:hypothetical protein
MQPPDIFHCKAYIRVIDAEVVKTVNAFLKHLPQLIGIFLISQRPTTDLSCCGYHRGCGEKNVRADVSARSKIVFG